MKLVKKVMHMLEILLMVGHVNTAFQGEYDEARSFIKKQ